jgi:uncharacterized protein (DUF488 family)
MIIYTIGFTQKTAKEFFTLLTDNKVDAVIDIRLNNSSQLAGFTKMYDLEFFLKAIGKINYVHYPLFAPTKDILKKYKGKSITWNQYKTEFEDLLKERDSIKAFLKKIKKYKIICLLCSEGKAINCHRSIVANYIKDHIDFS